MAWDGPVHCSRCIDFEISLPPAPSWLDNMTESVSWVFQATRLLTIALNLDIKSSDILILRCSEYYQGLHLASLPQAQYGC